MAGKEQEGIQKFHAFIGFFNAKPHYFPAKKMILFSLCSAWLGYKIVTIGIDNPVPKHCLSFSPSETGLVLLKVEGCRVSLRP